MKSTILLFVIAMTACTGGNKQTGNATDSVVAYALNDTIPLTRKQISKVPVASYMIPINNPVLQQYFGVKVYETPFTFKYLLKMQYEGMIETDTLKIPNFGTWPIVEVHKGADKRSCIIGFLDKQKNFKEYKILSAKGDKLSLVTLKRYGVGVYSSSK